MDPRIEDSVIPIVELDSLGASQRGVSALVDNSMVKDAILDGDEGQSNPVTKPISSRTRNKLDDALPLYRSMLNGHHVDAEDNLLRSLYFNLKTCDLSPAEVQVMALTIKACREDFAMSDVYRLIKDLTMEMKVLTTELDDSKKKTAELNHHLDGCSLKVQSIMKLETPTPSFPRPLPTKDRADEILKQFVRTDVQQYPVALDKFTNYLDREGASISTDTYKAMSPQTFIEVLKIALGE